MLDGSDGDERDEHLLHLMMSRRRFPGAGQLDQVAVEFPGEVKPVHGEVEAVVAVSVVLSTHVFHLDLRPLVPNSTRWIFSPPIFTSPAMEEG